MAVFDLETKRWNYQDPKLLQAVCEFSFPVLPTKLRQVVGLELGKPYRNIPDQYPLSKVEYDYLRLHCPSSGHALAGRAPVLTVKEQIAPEQVAPFITQVGAEVITPRVQFPGVIPTLADGAAAPEQPIAPTKTVNWKRIATWAGVGLAVSGASLLAYRAIRKPKRKRKRKRRK
jgi:hypothetical protein